MVQGRAPIYSSHSLHMKITAKAPCRVDLAGGTIDIWPLYLFHSNPVTVNFAVDRFASCVLRTRADARITLRSRDLKSAEEFESLAALRAAKRYKLPLAAYVVRYFAPETGLDLETDSEAPAGAGISGSSTLIIALGLPSTNSHRRGISSKSCGRSRRISKRRSSACLPAAKTTIRRCMAASALSN